jgi:galactokinase
MNAPPKTGDVRRDVEATFAARFGDAPELLVRAPGRVNLIGEHTDYNDGFVLPAAIDRELWIALRPRPDRRVLVHSLDFGPGEFPLDGLSHGEDAWIEYAKGVAWVLGEEGRSLTGWEGVLGSDIPIGAGLSSSAALEMAALRAFAAVSGFPWEPKEAALLGQRVENHWMKVNSGIMDQLAVGLGRAGHALLIDCRSLEVEPVPLPDGVALVVLDTGTRRGLVGSAYNERRERCEAAARACGVPALRDVDAPTLAAVVGLEATARRRARHVVTENARTLEAARVLRSRDLERMGRLMDESHASLRDDFEVSTEALDTIVDLAGREPGCVGARMTGAGFGGCAIAMVEEGRAAEFARRVADAYRAALDLQPEVYVCRAAEGVEVVDPSAPPGPARRGTASRSG